MDLVHIWDGIGQFPDAQCVQYQGVGIWSTFFVLFHLCSLVIDHHYIIFPFKKVKELK